MENQKRLEQQYQKIAQASANERPRSTTRQTPTPKKEKQTFRDYLPTSASGNKTPTSEKKESPYYNLKNKYAKKDQSKSFIQDSDLQNETNNSQINDSRVGNYSSLAQKKKIYQDIEKYPKAPC
jgi:hypothetical protein